MTKAKMEIRIPISENFSLKKAVCNHGFFMMAPNKWDPLTETLVRPLRLANHRLPSVNASIHHSFDTNFLSINLLFNTRHSKFELSSDDRQFIQCQVERMLHISEEDDKVVKEFHKINPTAMETGFGRIFRSPTLFEDMAKSLLLCNSSWSKSLQMAKDLCLFQHKLLCCGSGKKRKRCRCKDDKCMGNFPTPEEIISMGLKTLTACKLGPRVTTTLELAKSIVNGSLNLEDISSSGDPAKCYARLLRLNGFGPFVAANVMMCVGFYQYVPVDSETISHLKQVHGKTNLVSKKVEAQAVAQIYDIYEPYQCMAYWMERVEFYEKKLGKKLSELPRSSYPKATSTYNKNSSTKKKKKSSNKN